MEDRECLSQESERGMKNYSGVQKPRRNAEFVVSGGVTMSDEISKSGVEDGEMNMRLVFAALSCSLSFCRVEGRTPESSKFCGFLLVELVSSGFS